MTHSFQKSLSVGKRGEQALHKLFPSWTRLDGLKADFVTPLGTKIECKFESRASTETENFAMELQSRPGRPGAIQQAVQNGCEFITYLFSDGELFCFRCDLLLHWLVMNAHKHRQVEIPNKTYKTTIVLIPRKELRKLEVPIEQLSKR